MIVFKNISSKEPYKILKESYERAKNACQKNIEAIAISSYSKELDEVNSRLVNLKFIENEEFIFFSNYKSQKSLEFIENDSISALIYWPSINTQIRIKAKIKKKPKKYNDLYFKKRSSLKNALAISSHQSKDIDSYAEVLNRYNEVLDNRNLTECPDYWGGYGFQPFRIEFWEGNKFRLNKRDLYVLENSKWKHTVLQP